MKVTGIRGEVGIVCTPENINFLYLVKAFEFFFQEFSIRFQDGRNIYDYGLEFSERAKVFGNEKITATLHKAHILLLVGESFRFRESLKHQKSDK